MSNLGVTAVVISHPNTCEVFTSVQNGFVIVQSTGSPENQKFIYETPESVQGTKTYQLPPNKHFYFVTPIESNIRYNIRRNETSVIIEFCHE